MTLGAVGTFILWFGWYGFNPGSTLSAVDMQGIGRVATNTTLAACAGGMVAMYLGLWFGDTKGKFDVGLTCNGVLGGLVAITCPCYWVDPLGAILLGGIAGLVVYYGTALLEYLRIDDPIGAVPVHGLCGIWGTISLGFFAAGKYGFTGATGADNSAPVAGLFFGGDASVLKAQLIGSGIITIATFVISFILMYAIKLLPNPWGLRVEKHIEEGGLDLLEHGSLAYPVQ
jgi:Amt family ammonium transporter